MKETDHPPGPGWLARWVPAASWLPRYQRGWLAGDAIAGFTIWGLLIPEMIAYASLAGLPPQAGLYTLLASLALYAIFGTSRHLVVAGTSASAVLVFSAVTALGPKDAGSYATLAAGMIVLTGLIFVVAGLLKLGFITAFLSRPVMEGFVFGLAIFVTVSQLPKLFGLNKGPGDTVRQFSYLLGHLGSTSLTTLAVGLVALVLLFALERYLPRLPGGLIALGLANLGSGVLGGLACGGSLSQSAVNDGAGARSELSPIIAAALSLVTVVALTPLFTDLPEAVLAALIIHAVSHLMKVGEMKRFRRLVPREFWLAMLTLLGVIMLDVLPALIIGVVIALLLLVYQASRPRVSTLGADPVVPGAFADIGRHDGIAPVPGVLIVRPDAPLFYANAELVRDAIEQAVGSARAVVLVLDGNDNLDITSAEQLGKLAGGLAARNVPLGLAHVHGPALEMAERSGLLATVGTDHVFPTTPAAVAWAQSVADAPTPR